MKTEGRREKGGVPFGALPSSTPHAAYHTSRHARPRRAAVGDGSVKPRTRVSPVHALACLADAEEQYQERYKGNPLHAALAALLFRQAKSDYERAAKGRQYRPTAKRRSEVLKMLAKTGRAFSDASFGGSKRIQLDLARALRELDPYEADGRLLQVRGPEHKRGGARELYFIVEEVNAAPNPVVTASTEPPDEDTARIQRLGQLVSDWFTAKLRRRAPAELAHFEKNVQKGGVGYALAAFFGFVACGGALYYAVHRDFDMNAQAVMLGDGKAVAVVRWNPPSGIYGPFVVLKNGKEEARRDQPFYVDSHIRRDNYPGVEALTDVYRIKGYLWRVWPVVTTSKPPDDRLWPNEPCIVRDKPTLCISAANVEYWLNMPFAEFVKPAKHYGIVGTEHVFNAIRHNIEADGARVRPELDGLKVTHPANSGQPNSSGATESFVYRFDKPGPIRQVYRNVDTGKIEWESTLEVLTIEQVRKMAENRKKLKVGLYARKIIAPFVVQDKPATVRTSRTFPVARARDGSIALPQVASTYTFADSCGVSMMFYSSLPVKTVADFLVQVDYGDQDTDREALSENQSLVIDGHAYALFDFPYRPQPGEDYPLKRTVSVWVHSIDAERQLQLHEIVRKELTIPAPPGGARCSSGALARRGGNMAYVSVP